MNANPNEIVDRAKFGSARAELGAGFSRIIGYYRQDGARAIAEIETAFRQASAVALVRPAHTLKGDSLMFGADWIGESAERIEKAARDAVEMHAFPDQIASEVRGLRGLFADTLAFFDRELGGSVAAERAPPAAPRRVGFGRKVTS